MGTFALNAGIAGATEVTGLDISEYAVQQAEANAKLNHLEDTVHFRCANVLDELPKLAAAGEKYDVVILDPPAFTKSKEATKNAIKGYREINMKGLKLVKDGGYLATCSCSLYDAGTAGKNGKGSGKVKVYDLEADAGGRGELRGLLQGIQQSSVFLYYRRRSYPSSGFLEINGIAEIEKDYLFTLMGKSFFI